MAIKTAKKKLSPEKKNGHKSKQAVLPKTASEFVRIADLTSGWLDGKVDRNIDTHTARLVDPRLQMAQRSAIVTQIRIISGNQSLQRVLLQRQKKVQIPKEAIPSSKLSKWGTPEQLEFMRKVYDAQLRKSAADKNKKFFPGLTKIELEDVESGEQMHKDAAEDCKSLLVKAREDLKIAQEAVKAKQQAKQKLTKDDLRLLKVSNIGIISGYRGLKEDFSAWKTAFETQYGKTEDERAKLEDGEHSDKAVNLMVDKMYSAKAIPGYSNHNKGLAADFTTTVGKWRFVASTAQIDGWIETWFYKWLLKNAGNYKFEPYSKEPWHWDHKGGVAVETPETE